MIIFYGEGRLGNQLFQYQALSHVAKQGERIFAVGLEDLEIGLELTGPKIYVLTRSGLIKRIIKYVVNPLLLRPLARTFGIISYVSETTQGIPPHDGPGGMLSIVNGLLRGIKFVDGGHYQNASLWTEIFPSPLFRVNPQLKLAASQYLKSECGIQGRCTFVHVRRGDYLTFGTYGLTDLALPAGFYNDAIKEAESRIGKTHLVFVTDDPRWVEDTFRSISGKSVVSLATAMDFAVMTVCTSAILSNSTFSLAAAFLLDAPEIVIAPRYWLGFRVDEWFPPRIRVQHQKVLYLPVSADSQQS